MQVKFKKVHPDAKMPVKANENDFCYDVFAIDDGVVATDKNGNKYPGVWEYDTGLEFEIVRDEERITFYDKANCKSGFEVDFNNSPLVLDIDGRSRSSIYETGLILCNCIGTIDEPYRGHVKFMFYEVTPNASETRYKKGDKIGQIKIGLTFPIDFIETDELSETTRGEGGFGSSGR